MVASPRPGNRTQLTPTMGTGEAPPTIRRARGRCENRTHPRAPAANEARTAHQSRPSPVTTRAAIKPAGKLKASPNDGVSCAPPCPTQGRDWSN